VAVFIESDGMSCVSFYLNETQRHISDPPTHHPTLVNGFLATKPPKKHQNGNLPGVKNRLKTPATHQGNSGGIILGF
jgi:hypothetical protein